MRVAISVEGQTEEEFVKRVLAPYLTERGIVLTPIVLGAGRRGPEGRKRLNAAAGRGNGRTIP